MCQYLFIFFFNNPATPEIYPLSLHYALPIYGDPVPVLLPRAHGRGHPVRRINTRRRKPRARGIPSKGPRDGTERAPRSEEHTSELQSRLHLVCRLLLEKKKKHNV